MPVQFRNPFPLLIKFKTLINNPNSSLQSHRFFPHLRFFSSSTSSPAPVNCISSITETVVTTPMTSLMRKLYDLARDRVGVKRDSEFSIATQCRIKYNYVYKLILQTPFVIALTAGNLKSSVFRHYIAQDYYFLLAYKTAYSLAMDHADDDEAKGLIMDTLKTIAGEEKMHDLFVEWCKQEWGFDISQEPEPLQATADYTNFLLNISFSKAEGIKPLQYLETPFQKTKLAPYAIGAMTPIKRVYAYLAKEVLALVGKNLNSHAYKKWIETYSSRAYEEAASRNERLLDKLSVSLTGDELDVVDNLYFEAMIYELSMFLTLPREQKIVVPLTTELKETGVHLLLFSDFDNTCTKLDSTTVLATVAITTAPIDDENQAEEEQARIPTTGQKMGWGKFSVNYIDGFEECVDNTLRKQEATEEFDYEKLVKALKVVSKYEEVANMHITESGLLTGMNIEDIKRAASKMAFKDGCTKFFKSILETLGNQCVGIHIVSCCWCADVLRTAFSKESVHDLNIHANEFEYDENGHSTGKFSRNLETPFDKLKAFDKVIEKSGKDEKNLLTVYIGDSLGDLLCLLKADIGIVICGHGTLIRTAEYFGVTFVPLVLGLVEKQKDLSPWKGNTGILYTVSNWQEIHLLFFETNPLTSKFISTNGQLCG